MTVQIIDTLAGQRAALETGSLDLFRSRVMEPIAPFWQTMLSRRPVGEGTTDPALEVASAWGFYSPLDDREAGLEAIAAFEAAGTAQQCADAVQQGFDALDPGRHGFEVDLQFAFLLGHLRVLKRDYGAYTGAHTPTFAMVTGWPDPVGTPRLPVAAAHELNHVVRFTYEPWTPDTTVGQYMVAEGLAEAFGVEVLGDPGLVGPYSAALSPEQLAAVKPRFRDALDLSGFPVLQGYIFGDWAAEQFGYPKQGLPDYAGYSLGYQVVRAYLNNTGRSAAEATYVPWREIVEQSGYFEG